MGRYAFMVVAGGLCVLGIRVSILHEGKNLNTINPVSLSCLPDEAVPPPRINT